MKKFDLIVADPPWRYEIYIPRITPKYQMLSNEELEAIGPLVQEISSPRTVLFIWAPGTHLSNGSVARVVRSWGFEPIGIAFVWVKLGANGQNTMGAGSVTRSGAEFVIFGRKKKKISVAVHNIRQVFSARKRRHSEKPEEFFQFLDLLYPNVENKIEFFCRKPRPGWDVAFSNEVECTLSDPRFAVVPTLGG